MANNQNFIVKNGLTVGGNQYVIDSSGNWLGPQTAYANSSFATANVKSHVYTQDASPSTANVGDFWIDSSNGIEYLYTSSNSANIWVEYGPVGSPTGNITFLDQSIIGNVPNRDITILQQGATGNINLVTSNVITNGTMFISNHTFSNTGAALRIVGSTSGLFQPSSNPGYMLHITGQDNNSSRIVNDSFGTGAYALYAGRAARGNTTSPTGLLSGDIISRISGNPYGTTGYPQFGSGRIDIVSTEDQTDTNHGTHIEFWTTPNGSNTLIKIATFNGQSIEFTGNVIANTADHISYFHDIRIEGSLLVNTAILTANTTQYINYSDISLVLVDVTSTTTFVHQNFRTGSAVKVIAHNNTGTDRTINLSVPSLNCTATRDKNGKYNAPANSISLFAGTTACYDFISFDGDLANTYCVITPT